MFKDLQLAVLFVFIPILIFVMWGGYRWRRKRLEGLIAQSLWKKIVPTLHYSKRFWKRVLWVLGFSFVILALMRPQYGLKFEKIQRTGQDIFIVIDISRSMLAPDVKPNRFDRAKQEVLGLIENLEGDRIGLIAFAGDAYVQCPLTLDYSALRLFLDDLRVGSISTPGSDLPSAIKKARTAFKEIKSAHEKLVIILSDGESFENDPVKSAKVAKKDGVRIFTVGIGTPNGEPIPILDDRGAQSYLHNKDGQVVLSKIDERILKRVAFETGGKYYLSTKDTFVLDEVYKDISQLEKQVLEEKLYQNYKDRYQIVLFFALLFLLGDFLIPERGKRKKEWVGRI
jgi:Ca-activated chloride channel homolog